MPIPHGCIRLVGVLLLAVGTALAAPPARFVRFAEARAMLTELARALPADLSPLSPTELEQAWPSWIERHDREIRARLEQGDDDTLVNWLLFGTSFTSRPRAVFGAVESGATGDRDVVVQRTIELITARLDDLVAALGAPGTDERRLVARSVLQKKGLRFATAADRDAVRQYLLAAVIRVGGEQEQIDRELGATSTGDPLAEFVQRSRLFRTRGLSADTSLVSNHSVEQALAAMKARGLLASGSVRRVAIIGPGLDFADKEVGFDAYPPQTVQPFALVDSLGRLGLAPEDDPAVVLLDVSPRVVDHVTQARARAGRNVGYTVNLPLPRSTPWTPETRAYWRAFGDRIGTAVPSPASKALADVADLRAVRVRPSVVRRMSALDLNIVTERLDGEAFDLVVATNVFIYYDVFDQALALANVEAMLKPGAFLLANFSAPNLRSATMRPLDTTRTVFARNPAGNDDILDFIVWYRASAR
jgi:hypothetical protein